MIFLNNQVIVEYDKYEEGFILITIFDNEGFELDYNEIVKIAYNMKVLPIRKYSNDDVKDMIKKDNIEGNYLKL
jgi:hypothetical protein